MKWRVGPSTIGGTTTVPGDKSIAHRALMLAGLAHGTSIIENLPSGEDVLSTAGCMRDLGVNVEIADGTARLTSERGLSAPTKTLDAGNSGTTLRLLSGILAGQGFSSQVTGDESLRRRPMGRVVDPLRLMGACISTRDGFAPLEISQSDLHGIRYTLPVASAQVKSAVLLAGLFATGVTAVIETVPARDHTERMLASLGLHIRRLGLMVEVERGPAPQAFSTTVPGDMSSAAFLYAAAVMTGGEVMIEGVGLNPSRTAILDVLARMGARVTIAVEHEETGEPRGSTSVSGSIEHPIHIRAAEVPGLVDELPLIALLATRAPGDSIIEGAQELRVKETDRVAAVAQELRQLGAEIEERPDGWRIKGGPQLRGGNVQSHGDHRLAMMLAVAGASAARETVIDGAEASAVSFPQFAAAFASLDGVIETE